MDRKDPNQWLGLLRWSMQYQDGLAETDRPPMSEEDRKWLTRYFEEHALNPVGRMKEIVDLFHDHDAQDTLDITENLELIADEMIDLVSGVDEAKDLHKSHQFVRVIELLRSKHAFLRSIASEIIATATQNHAALQVAAVEASALQLLTHITVFDDSAEVRRKALHGISSIIQNLPDAEQKFISEGDGILVLLKGLRDDSDPRMQKKCMFLLTYLLRANKECARILGSDGIVDELFEGIQKNVFAADIELAEGIPKLLLTYIRNDPENVREFDHDNAKRALAVRIATISKLPADQSEDAAVEKDLIANLAAEIRAAAAKPRTGKPLEHSTIAPTVAATTTSADATSGSTLTSTQIVVAPSSEPVLGLPAPPTLSSANAPLAASGPFVATTTWQKLREGQAVPPGLHVRMDMTTGEKFAKLNDPNESTEEGVRAVSVAVDDSGAVIGSSE